MSTPEDPSVRTPGTLGRPFAALGRAVAARRSNWLDYVVLLTVFIVIYVGIILLRTQYFPDSAHYLGMALWFSGMSREDALQVALERHLAMGYEPNTSVELLFDWGLVKPRVVLPALSVPFVWLFGANGVTIVAGIAAFLFTFGSYEFLVRRYGRAAAVTVSLMVLGSMSIMLSNLGMLTESLSALWGLVTLVLMSRYRRSPHWGWLVGMFAVTVTSAFTRQATFIVAGAFVVAFLFSLGSRERRREWLWPTAVVAGTAIAMQLLQTALWPFSQADQYERMTGTDSLWGAILATPGLVKRILVEELSSYVLDDQILVVFLIVCAISLVVFWRRPESHLLLGALAGIALYNITNGNPTHFRYAIPGLIFFMASAALLVGQLSSRVSLNRWAPAELETPSSASPRS